jgi:hypothetical protein
MQLDEATNISQCSQLLIFFDMCLLMPSKKNCYFMSPLWKLRKFLFPKKTFRRKEKFHVVWTDGTPAMLGNTSGFATY